MEGEEGVGRVSGASWKWAWHWGRDWGLARGIGGRGSTREGNGMPAAISRRMGGRRRALGGLRRSQGDSDDGGGTGMPGACEGNGGNGRTGDGAGRPMAIARGLGGRAMGLGRPG